MKILILSSYYPPYFIGGYELRAEQMVHSLRKRGHLVSVLTSTHGVGRIHVSENVYRLLDARPDITISAASRVFVLRMILTELRNNRRLKNVLGWVKPDVILIMHIHSLLKSLVFSLLSMGTPTVFDISDPALLHLHRKGENWNKWFDWWESTPVNPVSRTLKMVLRQFISHQIPVKHQEIALDNAYFTSQAMKHIYAEHGFNVSQSRVIAPGICLADFPFGQKTPACETSKLLYAGRIAPEKGIETAIKAMGQLMKETGSEFTLTLAGPVSLQSYMDKLQEMIRGLSLERHIIFLSPRPLKQMPALYREHDIFIFPAVWEEPFGRAWIEALASGLPLATTATGGAKDYLNHEENCLIFQKEDAEGLAFSILRIIREAELMQRITKNGRFLVEKQFCFNRFIDDLESFFETKVEDMKPVPE